MQDDSHWKIGKNYFIRTVTYHFVGHLLKVTDKELVLDNMSWIAVDGRFSNAMKGEGFSEQEPYKPESEIIIGRGSLIDASIYNYDLPKNQK